MTMLLLLNTPPDLAATGDVALLLALSGDVRLNDALPMAAQALGASWEIAADAPPGYTIWDVDTGAAVATGQMTAGGPLGFYLARETASTGYAYGGQYVVRAAAAIGGIVTAATGIFRVLSDGEFPTATEIVAAIDADPPSVNTVQQAGGTLAAPQNGYPLVIPISGSMVLP